MTPLVLMLVPFVVTSSLLEFIQAVCDIPTGQDTTYGQKFYIPYPETTVPSTTTDISMTLYLLNPNNAGITVNVGEPGMTPEDISVPAIATIKKTLGYQNMSSGNVLSQAVTVLTSTEDFGVVVTMSHAMDGYTAIPVSSWGLRYMAVTYWQQGGGASQIVIIASEPAQVTVRIPPQDSRTISILDTADPAGSEDLIQDLKAGEVWQIQREYDLTGTSISSNKALAVFCGNTGTGVGSSQKVGAFMEQVPRTRSWGTQYVAFSSPEGSSETHDLIRVLALKQDTDLYATGSEGRITVKRGRYITRKLAGNVTYIQANRPVAIVKFTYSQSEFPTMTIVMPTAQFLKSETVLFPKLSSAMPQHLVVMTRKKSESCYDTNANLIREEHFELNSLDVITMLFTYNPSSSLATLSCSDASALLAVFLVMDYGNATFQSPLAYRLAHVNPDCTTTPQSPGDGVDNDCDGEIDEDVCTFDNETSASDCGAIHAGDPDVWGYRFSFLIPDHCSTVTNNVNTKLFITKLIDEDATVNVSTPLGSYQVTHTMSAATKAFDVYLPSNMKAVGSDIFDNITLLVTSDVEISVTLIDVSEDSSCYSMISIRLLPEDVLGNEYFAATHCWQKDCQIQVTAVHEGTTDVKVVLKLGSPGSGLLTFQGQEYDDKEEICVTLQKGQSFQLQVLKRDLTGTHILATKPIAVISGGRETTITLGSYLDGIAEQMPPVNTWGIEFFFYQSPTYYLDHVSCKDFVSIVSSEDDTHVQAGSEDKLLNFMGDMWMFQVSEVFIHILSSKPVLVIKMSKECFYGDADASMSVVTPVSQYGFEDILPHVGDKVYFWTLARQPSDGSRLEIQIGALDHLMEEGSFNASYFNGNATQDVHVVGTPNLFPFGGHAYNSKQRITGMHPIAFLAEQINQPCVITQGTRGDGIDNDCDGEVDEETCTLNLPADIDDDGMVNEDCAPEPPPGTAQLQTLFASTSTFTPPMTPVFEDSFHFTLFHSSYYHLLTSSSTFITSASWSCFDEESASPPSHLPPFLSTGSASDDRSDTIIPTTTSVAFSNSLNTEIISLSKISSYSIDTGSSTSLNTMLSHSHSSSNSFTLMPFPTTSQTYLSSYSWTSSTSGSASPGPPRETESSYESSSIATSSLLTTSLLSSEVSTSATKVSVTATVSSNSGIETVPTLQSTTPSVSPSTVSKDFTTLSLTPTPSLSSSTTTSSSVATVSTTPSNGGGSQTVVEGSLCSCECPANVVTTALEESELNQVLQSIQNELYVDKTEVSKTKRMYISAQDHRPSAQAVGWLGVGMISATFIGILLFDLPVLIREVFTLIQLCKANRD